MNTHVSPPMALAHTLTAMFSQFPQVSAIGLAGSQSNRVTDALSDIDLYVYTTAVIPLSERLALLEKRPASRADMNLMFWDLGDEWFDAETGIEVDVIYWDTAWIETMLERPMQQHLGSVGYSTCFWHTLRNSQILFDRTGWFASLQEKARQPYPEALRQSIVSLNHAVLRRVIPGYTHQIEKAVKRGDWVSVNHRVAALLASYFDVIFALNRVLNPGEKRLVQLAQQRCQFTPPGMAAQVEDVLRAAGTPDNELVEKVNRLVDGLDALLLQQGFDPHTSLPLNADL